MAKEIEENFKQENEETYKCISSWDEQEYYMVFHTDKSSYRFCCPDVNQKSFKKKKDRQCFSEKIFKTLRKNGAV